MGSYNAQVGLYAPDWSRHRLIGIDHCIALEVWNLWKQGILTTGCCCGHNINEGFIGVNSRYIIKMKKMGYRVRPNTSRPGAQDSFYPLSKF